MNTTSCNLGSVDVPWLAAGSGTMQSNHPYIAFLACREMSGRLTQISNYSYVGIQQTKRGIEPANRRTERKVSTQEISRVKEISSKPCPYYRSSGLLLEI